MSAKKYERFLYQTKTWIALRKVIEKWIKKGFWKKISLLKWTENCFLNNFGSEVDWYNLMNNLTVSEETVQNREFATAITENISDLKVQPWKSKLFRKRFLVRWGSFHIYSRRNLHLIREKSCNFLFPKTFFGPLFHYLSEDNSRNLSYFLAET